MTLNQNHIRYGDFADGDQTGHIGQSICTAMDQNGTDSLPRPGPSGCCTKPPRTTLTRSLARPRARSARGSRSAEGRLMGVRAAVVAQMSFAFAFAGFSTGPMDQLADDTIAHGAPANKTRFVSRVEGAGN